MNRYRLQTRTSAQIAKRERQFEEYWKDISSIFEDIITACGKEFNVQRDSFRFHGIAPKYLNEWGLMIAFNIQEVIDGKRIHHNINMRAVEAFRASPEALQKLIQQKVYAERRYRSDRIEAMKKASEAKYPKATA